VKWSFARIWLDLSFGDRLFNGEPRKLMVDVSLTTITIFPFVGGFQYPAQNLLCRNALEYNDYP
jgi:hypothetical protein